MATAWQEYGEGVAEAHAREAFARKISRAADHAMTLLRQLRAEDNEPKGDREFSRLVLGPACKAAGIAFNKRGKVREELSRRRALAAKRRKQPFNPPRTERTGPFQMRFVFSAGPHNDPA